jgi:hypothetical protein
VVDVEAESVLLGQLIGGLGIASVGHGMRNGCFVENVESEYSAIRRRLAGAEEEK